MCTSCSRIKPGANVIKLFTDVSHKFSIEARAFVLGKPFHPCLMFVGKANFFSEAYFRYSTLGYAPGLTHKH
jgi:hypothetical protein